MKRKHLVPAVLAALLFLAGASRLPARQSAPQLAPATTPGAGSANSADPPPEISAITRSSCCPDLGACADSNASRCRYSP